MEEKKKRIERMVKQMNSRKKYEANKQNQQIFKR